MTMLLWFPTPYPDELLYSVFARYHVRSGNTSPKMTTEELFGKRTIRSVWDLPANLNTLLSRMGPYWDADNLIFNHTMYSYYAAFLLPKQADQVKKSMMDDKGRTIHTRIGVSASNVKTKTKLWVCSDCIKEDMDTYGETYWHRIHQAPSVFICPKHETILEETAVSTKTENQHEYVIATPFIERKRMNLDGLQKEELQLLLKIAQITEFLLTNRHLQTQDNIVREKYVELLKQKGFASPNGFVKRDKLYQSFTSKFSDRCLELLQSPVLFEETNWLTMIFQKHRKSFHPIRHILVMLFLETDLDHLFNKEQYNPFGKGPWLCLNVACPNYHKPVVTSLTITRCYDTGKPVGTFRCNCGFVFSRRGPDKNSNDRYRIGTIKEYGKVWKDKLTELVNEGYSLTDISKELQTDRATIKKYAAELGLKVPWKLPKIEKDNPKELLEQYEDQLAERKNKWLELQELYPEKSKTELRKMAPDVYAFLYRHDRDWLNKYSPSKKRIQPPKQRVNWDKRDKEILKMVKEVVRTWDLGADKPTRITKTSIGKKINQLSLLEKKGDKLPKTMNYISQVEESLESFQMRRVEFVIEKLKQEGQPIIEWQIYKKAGLRSTVSNEVKRFISKKVTEYDSIK
ncbi:TnsD family Tn7-like transposition protein [Anoxybacillus flavithermus]|uniref:TnsD family Tn7-like transposition protein n=1 Tax=Anoxybacillus flavithermus TaxID=33934 RepID=UPI001868A9B1|nr:TnsD family Tn7-like transposition protein [Anoxybacillus flavithermus]MBE2911508.1 transposase [Anoxybacillus flavithermus]